MGFFNNIPGGFDNYIFSNTAENLFGQIARRNCNSIVTKGMQQYKLTETQLKFLRI